MIIIHKKKTSQSNQSLKVLANEQLTKMGWTELKFPDKSKENAKDALPGDIWGYVLRLVQDESKAAIKRNNKQVVFVSFIMKDHQNIWMKKAVKTYNFSSELDITLLISNANEDKILVDLKTHFGKWDEEVMTLIHASIDREEKKNIENMKKEQKNDDIYDDLKRAENERQAQEQARRLNQEHKNQLTRQQAEFDRKEAELAAKTELAAKLEEKTKKRRRKA